MACSSSQKKTEKITERVFDMKREKEKIDLLLKQNATKQLTSVDWDKLNTVISNQLDQAETKKSAARKYPVLFKIAAGFAAAAVLLIAIMLIIQKPADIQFENGKNAIVKFIDAKGSAVIEIKPKVSKAQAIVDINPAKKGIAFCRVQINDLNGSIEKSDASWIIITKPQPVFADNGTSRDILSMICLF